MRIASSNPRGLEFAMGLLADRMLKNQFVCSGSPAFLLISLGHSKHAQGESCAFVSFSFKDTQSVRWHHKNRKSRALIPQISVREGLLGSHSVYESICHSAPDFVLDFIRTFHAYSGCVWRFRLLLFESYLWLTMLPWNSGWFYGWKKYPNMERRAQNRPNVQSVASGDEKSLHVLMFRQSPSALDAHRVDLSKKCENHWFGVVFLLWLGSKFSAPPCRFAFLPKKLWTWAMGFQTSPFFGNNMF